MARAKAEADDAPSSEEGEAGQETTPEQIEKEAADAQAKADEEAKALKDAEDEKAAKDAQDALDAADKATQEAADAQAKADEEAKAAPVAENWSLPEVGEFPAVVSITNGTPSKVHIYGTHVEVEAHATEQVTFHTAKAYQRFRSTTSQIADLKGWKQGEGVTVGAQNGED